MVDIILHIIICYSLTRNIFSVCGTIIPDILYLVSIIVYQKNYRNTFLWNWGKKTHSFFFIPFIFIFNSYMGIGFFIHLIVDFFTHKYDCPAFFFPFKEINYNRFGLIQWDDFLLRKSGIYEN